MTKVFRKLFWLTCAVLALNACNGQLYQVAAPPKIAPPALATDASGLVAAAQALNGDQALEQFDANLLLAGVVAVDMRLVNRTTDALTLGALRWELSDGRGTPFKLLTPKQALGRVMRFYGNRIYVKTAYQNTRESYETLALPLTATLGPGAEKRGFLFFETKQDATGLSGLTLTISGQAAPLILKLN